MDKPPTKPKLSFIERWTMNLYDINNSIMGKISGVEPGLNWVDWVLLGMYAALIAISAYLGWGILMWVGIMMGGLLLWNMMKKARLF